MPEMELVEVALGVHFLMELTLESQLGERFYRQLTRQYTDLFTKRLIQLGPPFVFVNETTKTQLILNETNFLFTVRQEYDPDQFRERCNSITTALANVFELNDQAFRIFGKVHRYRVRHPHVLEALKRMLPGFSQDPLHTLRIRASLRQDGKNIHLQFASLESDREPVADMIFLECDINNADQNVGHSIDLANEIMEYADRYQIKALPRLIREKLGIGD